LEPKTVRFYERKGLIAPQRIGKMRLFTAHDVERLKSIKALRGLGMPITSIRTLLKSCRYIDFSNPPAEVKAAIEEALQEQRERLEQLEGQFKNMFEEQEPRQSCELNGG
jgi:DNA-binding transcriptional MerR regulator